MHDNDVGDYVAIIKLIKDVKRDAMVHLAGQVAMATSVSKPRLGPEINVVGSFDIIGSVRE